MIRTRAELAKVVRPFAQDGKLRAQHIGPLNALAEALGIPPDTIAAIPPMPPVIPVAISKGEITERVALELIGHEAIVREAYKDSKGIWTWAIGITDASGHTVGRYKDNPQPISRCLAVYVWLLRTKYGPEVMAAFNGFSLTEAQFAGALSFHYNTGAIGRAGWVKKFRAGDLAGARKGFMEWRKPPEIIERREKERDLFFDGVWSADGKATVYEVAKPSYSPKWSSAKRVDITADLQTALAAK